MEQQNYNNRRREYNNPRSSHGRTNWDWDQNQRSHEDWSSRGRNQNYGRSDYNSDYENDYRRSGSHGKYHPYDDGNYGEYGRSDASDARNYGGSGSYGYRNSRDDYEEYDYPSYNRNYNRGYSDNRSDYRDSQNYGRSENRGNENRFSGRHYNDDRNFFQRAGDKIRDTWNDVTDRDDDRGYRGKFGFENHNYDRDYYENRSRSGRNRNEGTNYYSGTHDSYDQNNESYFNPRGNRRNQFEDWNVGNYGDRSYENNERERYAGDNRKRSFQDSYSW